MFVASPVFGATLLPNLIVDRLFLHTDPGLGYFEFLHAPVRPGPVSVCRLTHVCSRKVGKAESTLLKYVFCQLVVCIGHIASFGVEPTVVLHG